MNQEILSLLEVLDRKNSYLLEFHKINTEELTRLIKGNSDNLENFYYSREILLNAISKIDAQILKQEISDNCEINKRQQQKLEDILKFKSKMVLSIVDQDFTIISLVDKLQNNNEKKDIAS